MFIKSFQLNPGSFFPQKKIFMQYWIFPLIGFVGLTWNKNSNLFEIIDFKKSFLYSDRTNIHNILINHSGSCSALSSIPKQLLRGGNAEPLLHIGSSVRIGSAESNRTEAKGSELGIFDRFGFFLASLRESKIVGNQRFPNNFEDSEIADERLKKAQKNEKYNLNQIPKSVESSFTFNLQQEKIKKNQESYQNDLYEYYFMAKSELEQRLSDLNYYGNQPVKFLNQNSKLYVEREKNYMLFNSFLWSKSGTNQIGTFFLNNKFNLKNQRNNISHRLRRSATIDLNFNFSHTNTSQPLHFGSLGDSSQPLRVSKRISSFASAPSASESEIARSENPKKRIESDRTESNRIIDSEDKEKGNFFINTNLTNIVPTLTSNIREIYKKSPKKLLPISCIGSAEALNYKNLNNKSKSQRNKIKKNTLFSIIEVPNTFCIKPISQKQKGILHNHPIRSYEKAKILLDNAIKNSLLKETNNKDKNFKNLISIHSLDKLKNQSYFLNKNLTKSKLLFDFSVLKSSQQNKYLSESKIRRLGSSVQLAELPNTLSSLLRSRSEGIFGVEDVLRRSARSEIPKAEQELECEEKTKHRSTELKQSGGKESSLSSPIKSSFLKVQDNNKIKECASSAKPKEPMRDIFLTKISEKLKFDLDKLLFSKRFKKNVILFNKINNQQNQKTNLKFLFLLHSNLKNTNNILKKFNKIKVHIPSIKENNLKNYIYELSVLNYWKKSLNLLNLNNNKIFYSSKFLKKEQSKEASSLSALEPCSAGETKLLLIGSARRTAFASAISESPKFGIEDSKKNPKRAKGSKSTASYLGIFNSQQSSIQKKSRSGSLRMVSHGLKDLDKKSKKRGEEFFNKFTKIQKLLSRYSKNSSLLKFEISNFNPIKLKNSIITSDLFYKDNLNIPLRAGFDKSNKFIYFAPSSVLRLRRIAESPSAERQSEYKEQNLVYNSHLYSYNRNSKENYINKNFYRKNKKVLGKFMYKSILRFFGEAEGADARKMNDFNKSSIVNEKLTEKFKNKKFQTSSESKIQKNKEQNYINFILHLKQIKFINLNNFYSKLYFLIDNLSKILSNDLTKKTTFIAPSSVWLAESPSARFGGADAKAFSFFDSASRTADERLSSKFVLESKIPNFEDSKKNSMRQSKYQKNFNNINIVKTNIQKKLIKKKNNFKVFGKTQKLDLNSKTFNKNFRKNKKEKIFRTLLSYKFSKENFKDIKFKKNNITFVETKKKKQIQTKLKKRMRRLLSISRLSASHFDGVFAPSALSLAIEDCQQSSIAKERAEEGARKINSVASSSRSALSLIPKMPKRLNYFPLFSQSVIVNKTRFEKKVKHNKNNISLNRILRRIGFVFLSELKIKKNYSTNKNHKINVSNLFMNENQTMHEEEQSKLDFKQSSYLGSSLQPLLRQSRRSEKTTSKENSQQDLNKKESLIQRFDKEKSLQKRHRRKKLKLETRRRKKRKRFYPRPVWLRYSLYKKFLNFRHSYNNLYYRKKGVLSSLREKPKKQSTSNSRILESSSLRSLSIRFDGSSAKPNSRINAKEPMRFGFGIGDCWQSSIAKEIAEEPLRGSNPKALQFSNNEKLKNKIYRNNKQKWGNFIQDTPQFEQISLKKINFFYHFPVFQNKEYYKVSGRILAEFQPLCWKSYWLRSNLTPYMNRIEKNFSFMKQVEKTNNISNINRFLYKIFGFFSSARFGFADAMAFSESSKFGIFDSKKNSMRDFYSFKFKMLPFYTDFKNSFDNQHAFYLSNLFSQESTNKIAEYNRIEFERFSEILKNVKFNMNLEGQLKPKSYKFIAWKYLLSARELKTFNKKNFWYCLSYNMNPNLSSVSPFVILSNTFSKNSASIKPYGSSGTLRTLWTFNKTNIFTFKEKNQIRNLWEQTKLHEQLKSNQTKKFLMNVIKVKDNLYLKDIFYKSFLSLASSAISESPKLFGNQRFPTIFDSRSEAKKNPKEPMRREKNKMSTFNFLAKPTSKEADRKTKKSPNFKDFKNLNSINFSTIKKLQTAQKKLVLMSLFQQKSLASVPRLFGFFLRRSARSSIPNFGDSRIGFAFASAPSAKPMKQAKEITEEPKHVFNNTNYLSYNYYIRLLKSKISNSPLHFTPYSLSSHSTMPSTSSAKPNRFGSQSEKADAKEPMQLQSGGEELKHQFGFAFAPSLRHSQMRREALTLKNKKDSPSINIAKPRLLKPSSYFWWSSKNFQMPFNLNMFNDSYTSLFFLSFNSKIPKEQLLRKSESNIPSHQLLQSEAQQPKINKLIVFAPRYILIFSILFHLSILFSFIRIPELRGLLKFQILLFYKISNSYFIILYSIYDLLKKYKTETFKTYNSLYQKTYKLFSYINILDLESQKAYSFGKSDYPGFPFGKETKKIIFSELKNQKIKKNQEKSNFLLRQSRRSELKEHDKQAKKPKLHGRGKNSDLQILKLDIKKNSITELYKRFISFRNIQTNFALFFLYLSYGFVHLSIGLFESTYQFLLKIIDLFESFLLIIYKFLEKPAELMIEWIAQIFLIEWSSDPSSFIPETFDMYFWYSFQKFFRNTRILGFVEFQNSTNIYNIMNSLELNGFGMFDSWQSSSLVGFAKDTKQLNGASVFSFPISNILGFFMQRRLWNFFHLFIDSMLKPDIDLIVRQKKGKIFWDIWADILIRAAEQYNINIPSLTSLKEEQEKLIERLIQDPAFINFSVLVPRQSLRIGSVLRLFWNLRSLESKIPKRTRLRDRNAEAGNAFGIQDSALALSLLGFAEKPKQIQGKTEQKKTTYSRFADKNKDKISNILYNKNVFKNFYKTKSWSSNQYVTYNLKDTDLFLDISPPKSLLYVHFINGYEPIQYTLGSIMCEIYSGLFSHKVSKNLLIVNSHVSDLPLRSAISSNFFNSTKSSFDFQSTSPRSFGSANSERSYGSLIIQALAGESEMKMMIDNANRYASIQRGVAVGMKLLRDVFESIVLQTPCFFLMEDLHIIGERRPMLISDDENSYALREKEFSIFGFEQDEESEKNQMIYQSSRHSINDFRRPYKGDFSMLIPTNLYNKNLYSFKTFLNNTKPTHQKKYPISLPSLHLAPSASRGAETTIENKMLDQSFNISRLQIASENFFAPPATSPFTILMMKEQRKFKPKKVVKQISWNSFVAENIALPQSGGEVSKNDSIRVKVAILADMTLRNFSYNKDMITDLLVIIDGVRSNRGFVVFATTHLPSILDPALRRPGRFDETISLPLLPNLMNRWSLFQMHFGSDLLFSASGSFCFGIKDSQITSKIPHPKRKGTLQKKFALLGRAKAKETFDRFDYGILTENFNFTQISNLISKTKLSCNVVYSESKKFGIEDSKKKSRYNLAKSPIIHPSQVLQNFFIEKDYRSCSDLYENKEAKMLMSLRQSRCEGNTDSQTEEANKIIPFNSSRRGSVRVRNLRFRNSRPKRNFKKIYSQISFGYFQIGNLLISSDFLKDQTYFSLYNKSLILEQSSPFVFHTLYSSLNTFKMFIMRLLGGKIAEFLVSKNQRIGKAEVYDSFNSINLLASSGSLAIEDYSQSKIEKQQSPIPKKPKEPMRRQSRSEQNRKSKIIAPQEVKANKNRIINDKFNLSCSSFTKESGKVQKLNFSIMDHMIRYKSWHFATSLIFSILQKRFLYNKNLIITKMLSFDNPNQSSLREPPSPPASSLLMPSKKYENFKRIERDFQQKSSFSIYEKMQMHQKQRFLKKLYNKPVLESFKSQLSARFGGADAKAFSESEKFGIEDSKKNSMRENRLTSFESSFKEFSYNKDSNLLKLSSSHSYYKNRLNIRHRFSLINQWWNGQLAEHNVEITYLSDIDWRTMYVQSFASSSRSALSEIARFGFGIRDSEIAEENPRKQSKSILAYSKTSNKTDSMLDFPDAEQYYNPRIRRWFLNANSWNYWLNFENTFYYEIYSHMIYDSFNKTSLYFNQNRELLDFFVYTYNIKGSLKEIDLIFILSRFYRK
uniref:Cell division protein n=1 Tax=Pediastrum angulosum TaxID=271408 RepID=A0A2U8GHD3_9CHLO|nr:cell division protein [Pediastrum angulosum]AWI68096.1 cell division protein [Pediastrum angulosum]